jgi:hypothetical protein
MVSRRAFLGGLSAATASAGGCLGFGEPREVQSAYRYHASVNPTAAISDVTLYLPVPVRDGTVAFADALTGTEGIRPEDWSYAIVDTDRDPMLEIRVGTLAPTDRPYAIEIDVFAEAEIDTRDALATEPTLSGRSNLQERACSFPHPDEWDDRLRCYAYESAFYGEYEPTGTSVAVDATFTGENSWFAGGWTGNEYTDFAHGFVDGTGWASGQGSLRQGVGRY